MSKNAPGRIEQLEAENARLREAILPISLWAERLLRLGNQEDFVAIRSFWIDIPNVLISDLRRIVNAMNGGPS